MANRYPTKPIATFAVVLLFVVLSAVGMFNAAGLNYSDFYRELIAEVGVLGLLLYWLYNNRKTQQLTLNLSYTRIGFLSLLVLASLSVFWAVSVDFFVSKYLLWLATGTMFFLALTLPINTKTMIVLGRGFALIAAYIAIIGLIQALLSIDIFIQVKPPAANFVNKNSAMQVMVLITPIIFFLLLFDRHKYASQLYYFLIAFVLAYAFHTQTRAAWLAISLMFLVMVIGLFWCRKHLKNAIHAKRVNSISKSALVLALIVFLGLINPFESGFSGIFETVTDQVDSLQQDVTSYSNPHVKRQANRYLIWEDALHMIGNAPLLGTGMGSFFHNLLTGSENYWGYSQLRAHNDLLETGVELGIIGLMLLLGALIGLGSGLYQLVKQGDIEQRIFYVMVTAALAGSAVNMQFSFPYQMPVPLMIFGLYAGLIVKGSDVYNTRLKTIVLKPNRQSWLISIIMVGAILVSVLMMNLTWLNTISTTSNNFKQFIWNKSVNPLLGCHRSIVKTFSYVSGFYTKSDNYKNSLKTLESLNYCVPDTWLYQQKVAYNLIKLQRYHEAIKMLDQAKKHAPLGIYNDYINQFISYQRTDNLSGAKQVYQQLIDQPTKLLLRKGTTLRAIISMSLHVGQVEQTKTFYQLHHQYFPNHPEFEAKVLPFLD